MGYKRKIVAATSEPYPDGTIRPPEELEAAFKRRSHVPLTLGHPPSIIGPDGKPKPGPVPEHLLLGDVEYSYDKEGKRKIANMTFFTEYFQRLPQHIRDKVVNLDWGRYLIRNLVSLFDIFPSLSTASIFTR